MLNKKFIKLLKILLMILINIFVLYLLTIFIMTILLIIFKDLIVSLEPGKLPFPAGTASLSLALLTLIAFHLIRKFWMKGNASKRDRLHK